MPKKARRHRIWLARRARLVRKRCAPRHSQNSAHVTITAGVVCETPLELNFSSPRNLFKSLIDPVTEDEFFRDYWEKKPLLITRGGGNIPLFTLETLRQLVQQSGPLLFGRHVNVSRYKSGRRRSYGVPGEQLTTEQLELLWTERKATVQFLQPQHFQDKLWQMLSLLESYFNCLVGSNVYITPSGSQGLAPHYDDVEVFIIQLEGCKKWKLYRPTHPLPRSSSLDLQPTEIGRPSHEITLHVGDVLYFPRGTIHQASTPSSTLHSTHITISTFQQHTWGDLLADAFSYGLEQLMSTRLDFREGLPLQLTQGVTEDTKPLPGTPVRDRLIEMGDSVLKSATLTLIRRHKLSFITNRLPPFDAYLHPQGPAPTVDSKVQLKWPDHMVVLREWEVREMEGCGLLPPRLRQGRGREGERGEQEEEVVVYHSVANDRSSHMVEGEGERKPRGVRLPARNGMTETALGLLIVSPSAPIPAATLPVPPWEDILPILLPLWAEGLLLVT